MNSVYPVERARLSQNQKKNISMDNELVEIIKQNQGIQSEVHRKKSILDGQTSENERLRFKDDLIIRKARNIRQAPLMSLTVYAFYVVITSVLTFLMDKSNFQEYESVSL